MRERRCGSRSLKCFSRLSGLGFTVSFTFLYPRMCFQAWLMFLILFSSSLYLFNYNKCIYYYYLRIRFFGINSISKILKSYLVFYQPSRFVSANVRSFSYMLLLQYLRALCLIREILKGFLSFMCYQYNGR